jgi:hypothetical protein
MGKIAQIFGLIFVQDRHSRKIEPLQSSAARRNSGVPAVFAQPPGQKEREGKNPLSFKTFLFSF